VTLTSQHWHANKDQENKHTLLNWKSNWLKYWARKEDFKTKTLQVLLKRKHAKIFKKLVGSDDTQPTGCFKLSVRLNQ